MAITEQIGKLGLGMMRLPKNGKEIDFALTCKMVDRFLESGFTYFDTAYVYDDGNSEIITGKALVARHERSSFQLATKLPAWVLKTKADCEKVFNTSLERTQAGYFDFYLLHAINREHYKRYNEMGAWEFIAKKKSEGQIRHIGFSFHDTADVLDMILTEHPEVEFVQLQINYMDWEHKKTQSRLCYETAVKHNKKIIIMEPVKGGSLAVLPPDAQQIFKAIDPNASVASWAIRYAANLDNIITVLSGMSNEEQLEDNIQTVKNLKKLDNSDKKAISDVIEVLQSKPTIPCTACKYCISSCPMEIPINRIFRLNNDLSVYGNEELIKKRYADLTAKKGNASSCIKCGKCASLCPQKIEIPQELEKIKNITVFSTSGQI